jgi:enoyl-CoA hydratase/carnithine racemase
VVVCELLVVVVAGAFVALVVMLSIVAPLPAVPAEPVPADDPPLVVLPGGELTPTVGVLVRVAPDVAAGAGVLVSAPPDVAELDGLALPVVVDGVSVGSVTAPVPTWPPLSMPEAGTLAGPVAVVAAVCATAACAAASDRNPIKTTMIFGPRQCGCAAANPDGNWSRRAASGRVVSLRIGTRAIMTTTAYDAGASSVPIVAVADGRATIRLNRPREHNRLEPADLALLRETFVRIDRDPSVRVLVLTGTGKSFSSGYHIGALVEQKAGKPLPGNDEDSFEAVVDRLEQLRVPTIAALQGSVYGGATDLALACDFRIGVAGMRMLMPAARLGIIYYASGIERYVSRLGVAAAKRLFLLAEPIEAEEMRRVGYLDEIVPPEALEARVDALCAALAANAPLALAGLKRAINETAAGRLDRTALAQARACSSASEDHAEALKAWSEKRKPVFKGS